jgi:hypothetical protein
MKTINVIGTGIAGSIVAKLLAKNGFNVVTFDDNDKLSASRASSNLYCGGWLKKFSSWQAETGIGVLVDLFKDVEQLPFGGKAVGIRLLQTDQVLVKPDYTGTIVSVDDKAVWMEGSRGGWEYKHDAVVLCCGYRCNELLTAEKHVDSYTKVGHCMLFTGTLEGKAQLNLVSPFTHQKVFQYAPNLIYYADSVALLEPQYAKRQAELQARTLRRAWAFCPQLQGHEPVEIRIGKRPFIHGYNFGCLLNPATNVYVINSGGMIGLVAYAYLAAQLLARLK